MFVVHPKSASVVLLKNIGLRIINKKLTCMGIISSKVTQMGIINNLVIFIDLELGKYQLCEFIVAYGNTVVIFGKFFLMVTKRFGVVSFT